VQVLKGQEGSAPVHEGASDVPEKDSN
jgi:hypothetical protein